MEDFMMKQYPVRSVLRDGTPCSIRPLEELDEVIFRDFHQVIPEQEQLYVRSEIRDGELFRKWLAVPDYENYLPLLAFIDDQMVALGVLYQRPGGWKRHIGKVSFLTHPEFHGLGLIELLLEQIVESARDRGLLRLESELNGERQTAIKSMAMADFRELIRIPDYVHDMKAEPHDYVLMGMELITSFENLGSGD